MLSQQNYEELDLIGRGAYGTVFRARDHVNDRMVALKRVKIATTEEGLPVSTIREISMLKLLDKNAHPNIVRLYDVFQTLSASCGRRECILTLVFEYVDQDLAQFLERHPSPGLPEHVIKDMMQQLVRAIYFLHTNRMVHRDLKPQNILVTSGGRIKVADFGLARIYSFCMVLTSVVITLWYRAPEVLLQTTYATPVDMWSLGCIFAEMYNRRPLFPGRSDADQLKRICSVIGTPPQSEWPSDVSVPWSTFSRYCNTNNNLWSFLVPEMCLEGRSLLQKLLTFNPANRISAQEALDHAYFHGSDSSSSQDSGIVMLQDEVSNTFHTSKCANESSRTEASVSNSLSAASNTVPSTAIEVEENSEMKGGVGVCMKRKRSCDDVDDEGSNFDDLDFDDHYDDEDDDDDEDGDDEDDSDDEYVDYCNGGLESDQIDGSDQVGCSDQIGGSHHSDNSGHIIDSKEVIESSCMPNV